MLVQQTCIQQVQGGNRVHVSCLQESLQNVRYHSPQPFLQIKLHYRFTFMLQSNCRLVWSRSKFTCYMLGSNSPMCVCLISALKYFPLKCLGKLSPGSSLDHWKPSFPNGLILYTLLLSAEAARAASLCCMRTLCALRKIRLKAIKAYLPTK